VITLSQSSGNQDIRHNSNTLIQSKPKGFSSNWQLILRSVNGTSIFTEGIVTSLRNDFIFPLYEITCFHIFGRRLPDLSRAAKAAAHELHGANSFFSVNNRNVINLASSQYYV